MINQPELLKQHVQLLALAVAFATIALWIAWRFKFLKLPKGEDHPTPRIPLVEVLVGFAIYIGFQVLVGPLVWIFSFYATHARWPIHQDFDMTINEQGWFNIFNVSIASAFFLIYAACLGERLLNYWWKGRHRKLAKLKDYLVGVASWAVAYPTVLAIGQLISIFVLMKYKAPHIDQVAVKQLKTIADFPLLFWVTAGLIVSLIPIVEEILFRGLLQTWFKKRLGAVYAIALTSLIFALFHYSATQKNANLELLASLFTLSCFLGFLFEKQRSLLAPIGLHSTFNAVSIILILFS